MEHLFETIAVIIEVVAVVIIAGGIGTVLAVGVVRLLSRHPIEEVYEYTRRASGRALLLGLEVLIAADIVLTVTIDLTFESVGTLGLLVLIRTFLSWAIELETDGHWPWHKGRRRPDPV